MITRVGTSPDGRTLPRGITGYWVGKGQTRRVHYRIRPEVSGDQGSETFETEAEAVYRLAEIRVEKGRGGTAAATKLITSTTLREYLVKRWLPGYGKLNIEQSTLASYQRCWNKWIKPYPIARMPLAQITTEELLDDWSVPARQDGIGDQTFLLACAIISSVFKHAAQRPKKTGVYVNPVTSLPKPSRKALNKRPSTYPPRAFEEIRYWLRHEQDPRRGGRGEVDALFVSVMAYCGLRPGEALGLRKHHLLERHLDVKVAISGGEERPTTKTDVERHVPIPAPLLADLRAYTADLAGDALLFPGDDGGVWSDDAYKNWRGRVWHGRDGRIGARQIAAKRANLPALAKDVPYCCRHSYCALQIRGGMGQNLSQLARWMGTSVAMINDYYENVIDDYKNADPIDIDEEIAAAREAVAAAHAEDVPADLLVA